MSIVGVVTGVMEGRELMGDDDCDGFGGGEPVVFELKGEQVIVSPVGGCDECDGEAFVAVGFEFMGGISYGVLCEDCFAGKSFDDVEPEVKRFV